MPTFNDFIDQLDAVGIAIDGRDELIKMAESAPKWPDVVIDMAMQGRKRGVSLFRKASDSPSDPQLNHLLQGYPFTFEQRCMVVQNVLVRA